MIGFISIAKEGIMLLVWTRIPVATDYNPKPKKKKQKTGLPRKDDDAFEHYFLNNPRGILLLIQGNVAHSGSFCFGLVSSFLAVFCLSNNSSLPILACRAMM